MKEIDPVPAQTIQLTQPQPAVRADGDEGSVSRVDGRCEESDIARRQEAHLLWLDARGLDDLERAAHQDVVLDGRCEDSPERPVDLMDRRRFQKWPAASFASVARSIALSSLLSCTAPSSGRTCSRRLSR